MTNANPIVHKFESAGLGKAPFKCIERQELIHCIPGEAPRAGGSCDFCGTGIRYAYVIKSACGTTFRVGSECVRQTGDKGLIKVVSDAEAADRRKKADVKAAKDRCFILAAAFFAGLHEDRIRAMPHSKQWAADQGLSFYNEIEWLLYHAGTTGRLAVSKRICAALGVSPKTFLPV